MFYKKFYRLFLLSFFSLPIVFLISLIVIDPLGVLHKQVFNSKTYLSDFRFGALSVVKYANFDSIILGSSMMQNTSANQASKKFNESFVNISIGGTTAFEKASILRFALAKRKIKRVITTIEAYYLRLKESPFIPLDKYIFLYDIDTCPIINYIKKMNIYLIHHSRIVSWIRGKGFCNTLDCPAAWNGGDLMKTFGGFPNWVSLYQETKNVWILNIFHEIQDVYLEKRTKFPKLTQSEKRCIEERMYEDIVSIAINNPNTQFEIVIPPYSKLYWKVDMNCFFRDLEYAVKYLVDRSSKLDNLHIYGFDDEAFTKDIKNYKDKDHYHPKFNAFMVNEMAAKTHILTSSNVDSYFENFKKDIFSFDLKPFYEQIKDLRKNS